MALEKLFHFCLEHVGSHEYIWSVFRKLRIFLPGGRKDSKFKPKPSLYSGMPASQRNEHIVCHVGNGCRAPNIFFIWSTRDGMGWQLWSLCAKFGVATLSSFCLWNIFCSKWVLIDTYRILESDHN